ncbi:DNA sulfur modification protein DndE [Cellulosilyticum sp. WCF-2]|uniref:DNA sulfur modification protein DndE n=1 Tax=Cellulosilyticum sp. WCF-2 TaxID=2497860 RepID=UPI000F8E1906|nr:DNA sulfur modification protein DndE [Cellulosilyticum sp. WCF-2]QEH67655.1 DNA sulfur modification protein DndE [Cellulosilyticum sp. WCF-2]
MIFRLKTSAKCQRTLTELHSKTNITPNILCRYAISLSVLQDTPVDLDKVKDSTGQEFNRQILTGRYDSIFKAIIIQNAKKPLTDEEYFPTYIKAHIERGVELLKNNYDLTGNKDKFLINLARTQDGGHI